MVSPVGEEFLFYTTTINQLFSWVTHYFIRSSHTSTQQRASGQRAIQSLWGGFTHLCFIHSALISPLEEFLFPFFLTFISNTLVYKLSHTALSFWTVSIIFVKLYTVNDIARKDVVIKKISQIIGLNCKLRITSQLVPPFLNYHKCRISKHIVQLNTFP